MSRLNTFIVPTTSSKIGSTENGTIRNGVCLAVFNNYIYFCSVFETHPQNVELNATEL